MGAVGGRGLQTYLHVMQPVLTFLDPFLPVEDIVWDADRACSIGITELLC